MKKAIILLVLMAGLVYAGEYIDVFDNDNEIWIWDFAVDSLGQPWTGTTCNLTIRDRVGAIQQSGLMTELEGGLYNYSVGVIPTTGYYPMSIICNNTGTFGQSDRIGFYVKDEYGGLSLAQAGQAIALIIVAITLVLISVKFRDSEGKQVGSAFKMLFTIIALMILSMALYSMPDTVPLASAIQWVVVFILFLFIIMFLRGMFILVAGRKKNG